nr:immunoglobulin heavy chain junction region [Macaca mulatta]
CAPSLGIFGVGYGLDSW